jgi:hypothetical protein
VKVVHDVDTDRRRLGGTVVGGCLRGGSDASSSLVAWLTARTACSKASSVVAEIEETPLTFLTY